MNNTSIFKSSHLRTVHIQSYKQLVLSILLLVGLVHGYQNSLNIPWATTLNSVEKNYHLRNLTIDLLEENLKFFFGKKETKNFQLRIASNSVKINLEEITYKPAFIFHKEKLFGIIYMTDEKPITSSFSWLNEFRKQAIYGLKHTTAYSPIYRKFTQSGNIFGEGGLTFFGPYDSAFVEVHICSGSLTRPTHFQPTIFEFDIFKLFSFKNEIPKKIKDNFKPFFLINFIFTRYINDKILKKYKTEGFLILSMEKETLQIENNIQTFPG